MLSTCDFAKLSALGEKMPSSDVNSSTTPPTKRLLFDRRYGWVLDEWKEPSEEALSGGRGMFCIVPLAKQVFKKTSESINFVASSTLHVLERPELLSPKIVQAKIASSLVMMAPQRNIKTEATSCSSDLPAENNGSHTECHVD